VATTTLVTFGPHLPQPRARLAPRRRRRSSRARRRAPSVSSSPMATPAATLAVLRASRPRCRHAADVLAFAVHAATTSAGFRLVAAGPRAKDPSAAAAPSDPSADPLDGWDAWEDTHAFRYVPETTHRSARLVRDETSSSSEDDVREVTVTSLAVGDACAVSVSVVRRSGGSAGRGRPEKETATLQVPLAQHVDASLASTDPAGALRDVDALVALAEEKLFVRLALTRRKERRDATRDDATARDDGEREPCQTARDDLDRTDGRTDGRTERGFEGSRPPFGARFDPYGPPDIPEFAPGRFGYENDPTRGFPENPDAAFGGVPDGFHPSWPGGPVPGGRGFPPGRGGRGFPPPGWPPARGRGRGPPDLGPPPRGGGGFF